MKPTPLLTLLTTYPFLTAAHRPPRRAACPDLHVFGARETTAPPGFGTAGPVVDAILAAFPGATSEAIDYPAAGDDAYAASVQAGVQAVVDQVDGFVADCPDAQVVLVGYSQGGQIMDDAICGGGDPNFGVEDERVPLSKDSVAAIKAVVLLGDPRHTPGLPFNVGTSTAPGVSRRGPSLGLEHCTPHCGHIC